MVSNRFDPCLALTASEVDACANRLTLKFSFLVKYLVMFEEQTLKDNTSFLPSSVMMVSMTTEWIVMNALGDLTALTCISLAAEENLCTPSPVLST